MSLTSSFLYSSASSPFPSKSSPNSPPASKSLSNPSTSSLPISSTATGSSMSVMVAKKSYMILQ